MFHKRLLIGCAAGILLLTALPSLASAQQFGPLTVGGWYGKVFLQPNVGFPFQAVFNKDGTWSGTDARGFGLIPLGFPFTALGSTFMGQWVRSGISTYAWTGTQILYNPIASKDPAGNTAPAGWYILIVRGSHQVSGDDPNHMVNGQAGAKIFPCGPTVFGCPDTDKILNDPAPFPPQYTYALSRIQATSPPAW